VGRDHPGGGVTRAAGRDGQAVGRRQLRLLLTALILFEGSSIALALLVICSHRIERVRAQHRVLLGAAAGLGFGISDVAIKALTDDLERGTVGLVSPGARSS